MSDGDLNQVSAEIDGRVLTGVGTTVEALEKTLERHSVEEPAPTNSAEPAAEEPPKKVRGRERFSELTAERDAAREEAATAKREAEELKAKLAQPPTKESGNGTTAPSAPVAAAPETTRQKPTEDEIGTKYKTYGAFAEDLADYLFEQKIAKLDLDARVRSTLDADRSRQALDHRVGEMRERATKRYPDFNEVLDKGPGAEVDLSPDENTAKARMMAILNLPEPEHILYALGRDAAETARLAKLSDVEFGLALARYAPADASVASPASTGARVTVAPPPYQPVGGGSKTTVLPSAELPKRSGYDFDKSGYREKRAAERGLKPIRRR